MKKKISVFLSAFIISISFFAVRVSADMGPKPSVHIKFTNMGNEVCYCTLLSKKQSTGPYSVGKVKSTEEIPRAFQDYEDSDGFYYLEYYQPVSSSKSFDWGYYPPDTFKVLLYYPEEKTFAISEIIEKSAFHAEYTIDMKGIEEIGDNQHLQVIDSSTSQNEIFPFLLRVIITVLIEIAIALPFNFKEKHQLIFIAVTNVITQVLLNLLLNSANFYGGTFFMAFVYIPLEILVFAVEAAAYIVGLRRLATKYGYYHRISDCVLYSFLANFLSFICGFVINLLFPWIG